jgi:fumarate reductase flavoprotein subunit
MQGIYLGTVHVLPNVVRQQTREISEMVQQDYDVIVVGGGGARLAAAIDASSAGARVLVCEAASQLGGSTAVAGGLFLAADTKLQSAQGVTDSADAFFSYIMMMSASHAEGI